MLTDGNALEDNGNTDNRQDNGGLATTCFGLDSLDIQLSEVYRM